MKNIKYFKVTSAHIVAALAYAVTPSQFIKYDESLVDSIMKEHPNATLEFYDSDYNKITEDKVESIEPAISEEEVIEETKAEVIDDEQFEHKKFGNSKWKK